MTRLFPAMALAALAACSTDRPIGPTTAGGVSGVSHGSGDLKTTKTLYGPETFTRATGKPVTTSRSFTSLNSSPVTVSISSPRSQGLSVTVTLNGESRTITSDSTLPYTFNAPPSASNTLTIRMTGKPGSQATLTVTQVVLVAEPWLAASSPSGNRINRVWPLTSTDLYMTADGGGIFHSVDGGATWVALPSPFSTPAYDIWGTSASNLYVVSWFGNVQHWDGSTWTSVGPGHFSANDAIYRIWGSGANDIYAVGDDAMIWHFDGTAWAAINPGPIHPRAFQGVWGTGPNDVFVAGGSGGASGLDPAVVYHFDGSQWQAMPLPAAAASYYLAGIWGSSSSDVYVVGFNFTGTTGILLHYDGSAWSVVLTASSYLTQVSGTGPNDVYVTGGSAQLLHFDGTSWQSVAVPTTADLTAIYMAPDGSGWVGGVSGTLLHRNPY